MQRGEKNYSVNNFYFEKKNESGNTSKNRWKI